MEDVQHTSQPAQSADGAQNNHETIPEELSPDYHQLLREQLRQSYDDISQRMVAPLVEAVRREISAMATLDRAQVSRAARPAIFWCKP